MAKQPQTQTPVDIGLNLSGNALGSLTDLVTRMLQLREAASGVGAVLKAVNADIEKLDKAAGRKSNPLGVNVLKKINKEAHVPPQNSTVVLSPSSDCGSFSSSSTGVPTQTTRTGSG